jgi:Tfp pilus assembly protein PilN
MIATTNRTRLSQVNLLPPETQERQKTRRKMGLVAAAGAAVLVLMGLFVFMQSARISDLKDKAAAQNARNASLQQRVATLQPYQQLQQNLTTRQGLVSTALAGDVSWSNILHELSAAVPSKAWLISMAATSTQSAGTSTAPISAVPGAPAAGSPGIVGTLTFQADSLDFDTISSFLVRLQREPGWVNAWVPSAQRSAVGTKPVWTFSSSVDLTSQVFSKRGGGTR